jgi:hypothetical protein
MSFSSFFKIVSVSSLADAFFQRWPSSIPELNMRLVLQRAARVAAWKKKKEIEEIEAAAAAALLEQEGADEETAQLAEVLAEFAW